MSAEKKRNSETLHELGLDDDEEEEESSSSSSKKAKTSSGTRLEGVGSTILSIDKIVLYANPTYFSQPER